MLGAGKRVERRIFNRRLRRCSQIKERPEFICTVHRSILRSLRGFCRAWMKPRIARMPRMGKTIFLYP
jgi:hypothetical protein